ncbi:MAG: hypothetical protein ACJASB_000618 [Shewanella psychromarinicola]|jgi:hypothetical protein
MEVFYCPFPKVDYLREPELHTIKDPILNPIVSKKNEPTQHKQIATSQGIVAQKKCNPASLNRNKDATK